MSLESFVIEYIEGKRTNPLIKGGLFVLSLCFQTIIRARNFLYDTHLLKTEKVPSFVVSVGNIVAGGTGKTPFVEMLIKELAISGKTIAVLSRGYRSKNKREVLCVSKGNGPLQSVEIAGDEPYWLAQRTRAFVIVSKNRALAAKYAINLGASLIILEDGMQHRKLHRDMEIVILHGKDLFGKGLFLPAGYLRDLPESLAKASQIIVTHLDEVSDKEKIEAAIRRYSSARVIGFAALYTAEQELQGVKIGAFCGIGKPSVFYEALRSLGSDVVGTLSSEDHMLPSVETLKQFAKECKQKGASYLVCTEKDRIKLPFDSIFDLPILTVNMKFKCIWNENLWQELCQSIAGRK